MRTFLLGVLVGLLTVAVAAAALLVAISRPSAGAAAPRTPSATAPGAPPADLRKGETWLRSAALDSSSVLTSEGGFVDVHATASDVRMTAQGLRVGSLALDATLPFDTAARQVGHGVQLYAAGGGLAGIRRTSTALGRTVAIQATGTVSADHGQLVIEPQTLDLGGPAWLSAGLSTAARSLVTIRHTVGGLPPGMTLTRVSVGGTGFRVHLAGTRVSLTS
jgi:hypothetical protein